MSKVVEELRMYASMSNHPDLLIDAADEITILQGRNAKLDMVIARLRAALMLIRDAGPMAVDDQRWHIAKDALEGKS